MGTRKLIVHPGISAPCCRADLLTPVLLPPRPPFFLSLPWMNAILMNWAVFVVNLLGSASGGFLLEISQTPGRVCCGWTNSSGKHWKWWAHVTNNLYVLSRGSTMHSSSSSSDDNITQTASNFHSGCCADLKFSSIETTCLYTLRL